MKGLEKLTSMRLAEVLTQKGVVPADAITDALYIQDKHGEAFAEILVGAGHIAEWDLARVVVENFQLPFILAGSYQISDEARGKLPIEAFFEHLLVPMDTFGEILTVSMPVLTSAETLLNLESKYQVEIFPYVGLISENKKVLSDEFGEFKEWYKTFNREREQKLKAAKAAQEAELSRMSTEVGADSGDWANLFDDADAAVQDSIQKTEE